MSPTPPRLPAQKFVPDAVSQTAPQERTPSQLTVEMLESSVQRMRDLATISADWYWEQDADYRFLSFQAAVGADTLNGAILDGAIGKRRWELPGATALEVSWENHKKTLDARLPFRDFEFFRTIDNGTPCYLSASGVPVFDAHQRFMGYQGTARDITSQKAADARLRAVFSALAEGVVLRDAEGRIVDCNASAERIIGKTLAQIKGQTSIAPEWLTLREDGSTLPEEERPTVVAKRTGLPQSDTVICYSKSDGSQLWALVNVQPLFDGFTTTPSGFVTSLTDISKRKRAELEIVRLNVALENRVSRRTAQLEVANKELEAFSYSVAHDLRSPLSTINGFSALLQKALSSESGDRVQHYINRIRSGVQRMGELTDGLLSLAHLSRTSLHWRPVDLSAEAGAVVRHLSESDAGRQKVITIEDGLMVHADRSLIRQVLENLLANAWKFTSKKPQTDITIGRQTGTGQEPVYFVRDNGAGFDMAYADKLFGTFQRLHSPQEFSGTGIGLATVNRIIQRHGGKIWAHSVVGEGTTFYFTIGLEPALGAVGGDTGRPASPPAAPATPAKTALTWPLNVIPQAQTTHGAVRVDAFLVGNHHFSSAFENAAIGMALVAVDFQRLKVNSAFCHMLGYSEAEMQSRNLMDITHTDDIQWDLLQRQRALAGEIETYQWEKRYIHKTGRIVWGYLTCSLVRDADRSPVHFISQIQDITERRKNEQILRDSEERFRALTALSSDWFWEQDENFRFVEVTGYSSAKVASNMAIGKTRWELDNLHLDESVWQAHRAQLERHEVFRDFELARLGEQGQKHYRSISGAPIFNTAGQFTGYRGVGRDTTEIHRVNQALRASESQLRQITDTLPALIAYVDSEQRFRFHNRAYEEVFGLTFEKIDGQYMCDVLGSEFYEVIQERVEEVLAGYPVVYERTQKTARGTHRDYVVNYFPRYGEGNQDAKVIGFYSLATDITELKGVERVKSEFMLALQEQLSTPLATTEHLLTQLAADIATGSPVQTASLLAMVQQQVAYVTNTLHEKVASTVAAEHFSRKA